MRGVPPRTTPSDAGDPAHGEDELSMQRPRHRRDHAAPGGTAPNQDRRSDDQRGDIHAMPARRHNPVETSPRPANEHRRDRHDERDEVNRRLRVAEEGVEHPVDPVLDGRLVVRAPAMYRSPPPKMVRPTYAYVLSSETRWGSKTQNRKVNDESCTRHRRPMGERSPRCPARVAQVILSWQNTAFPRTFEPTARPGCRKPRPSS